MNGMTLLSIVVVSHCAAVFSLIALSFPFPEASKASMT
jgi:hypothetical protein